MASASGGEEEGGVGLLEEVSVGAEGLFFLDSHSVGLGGVGAGSVQGEIVSLKISSHSQKS